MNTNYLALVGAVTLVALVLAWSLGYGARCHDDAADVLDDAAQVAGALYDAQEDWNLRTAAPVDDEAVLAARTLYLTERLTGVRLERIPDPEQVPLRSLQLESRLDHRDGVHATPCAYPNRDRESS